MALAPDVVWAADKRVALVVGNSTYQTVPRLPNPSRDAVSVAKMFKDAGFDRVDLVLDVGNLDFKRAIRKFEALADNADIAVVYYAGHGLEIGGANYLIPVDARLASDRDADDEAITLERLVSSADGARRLRLIILDACRDNPYLNSMRREKKVASRAVVSGLGKVEPTSTDTLIAYAAKAGSTADDGTGEHSPFTTSLLKNLTVPGLDVRLAFGRVRDEVMKSTNNRQEPFVYGSLGGGNTSLVPAPPVQQVTSQSDIKTDYELVEKVGTVRAWQVFLGTHSSGFYADLARAQIERLGASPAQPQGPAPAPAPNMKLAVVEPTRPPSRETPSKEALEWDRIRDGSDLSELQKFIKRYPDSPLSINAQQRLDILKKAAQEREEKARAEREAAKKAVEEASRQAELRKAEQAAAKKLEEDERKAREAAAAEKARAAAAELAAAKKREEDERRARAAEAEQKARVQEAERKAAEAKQNAEQAERDRLAAEAASQRAASEKQAKENERRAKAAEAEQKAKAAEAERQAAEARQKAEQEAAAARAASERQAREAEAARKKAELAEAKEAACKSELGKLEELTAKGSEGSGLDNLKSFSRAVTCERLGPMVVATLDKFNAEAAKRAAAQPNSPELVRLAQSQLIRIGCLTGKADGTLSAPTRGALNRYLSIGGQPTQNVSITETFVAELARHSTRVCPIECKSGETLKGETCVANEKPAPATASRRPKDDDDEPRSRKQARRPAEREKPRVARPAPEAPRATQQAVARPSITSGGGGGRSSTMIGVGF